MTVTEIVKAYLQEHGYDGLSNEGGQCACRTDDKTDDLAPCPEPAFDCEVGYLAPCPPECGNHDYHIQAEKPGVPMKECSDCDGHGCPSITVWPATGSTDGRLYNRRVGICKRCEGTGKVVVT